MNKKQLRDINFFIHRYLGLIVALILVIVGLTGSILVFQREIDHFLVHRQVGNIVPSRERVPVEVVLNKIKSAYSSQPDIKVESIDIPKLANDPYQVWFSRNDKWTEVFIHPYTAAILGTREWEKTILGVTFQLHYQLLAGETGTIIVGIAALFLLILSITGFILWPGWLKLVAGFKIKLKAHIKRLNFDIHKVVGIISVVFLAMIAFTGFCWNFNGFTYPVIYAVTRTPKPPELVSQVVAGKQSISVTQAMQIADAALNGAATTYISIPTKPEGVFRVNKKFPQEKEDFGRSRVYIDQYTGQVLRIRDERNLPLGEKVLDSFTPMHYGTFGGLTTRIFYVFIGLAPLILSVTGLIMWWYRPKKSNLIPNRKFMT